jgi:hypothetical protein
MSRRASLAGLGSGSVAMVILGAWAGIVVFVGPAFGYSIDGSGSWQWNAAHGWLHFGPGVTAVVAGVIAMGSLPRLVAGRGRAVSKLAGALAIVSGAWLVVGPTAWPAMVSGAHVWALTTALRNLADQIGANLGPGVLLIIIGSFAVGLVARQPGEQVVFTAPSERSPLAA